MIEHAAILDALTRTPAASSAERIAELVERITGDLDVQRRHGHQDIMKPVNGVEKLYLRRWFLPSLGGGWRAFLHRIEESDSEPHRHDHPWDYVTLLAGRL